MLNQKAEQLGIHVSADAAAASAAERLRALGRNGQAVSLDVLVQQALAPKGLTAADFEIFIRHDLMIQELIQAQGLAGVLVTPQEASAAYQRERQELSAQVVFFSGSNYLASVKPTEAALGQFYTNFQAHFRLPDRVQVNYVVFPASNYLVQARAEWAKTNLSDNVEAYFHKVGETYRGSKSAAEAKQKITEELIEARAQGDARKDANAFATAVFAQDPPRAENLSAVAKQMGYVVHQTAPFDKQNGPYELEKPVNFTKTAFQLTADSPLAGPLLEGDAMYVLALAKTLPSELPALSQIHFQVAMDYQQREAVMLAMRAGQAFYQSLTNQMAAGHTFASVCVGAGLKAEVLPPFSLSTQEMPELGERASLGQIKQAAFTTPIGKPSAFIQAGDGGFILLVQSKLPLDQTQMASELPQFTQNLRRSRENEAFNQWLQTEAASALKLPK
jgi:hypothetical protein